MPLRDMPQALRRAVLGAGVGEGHASFGSIKRGCRGRVIAAGVRRVAPRVADVRLVTRRGASQVRGVSVASVRHVGQGEDGGGAPHRSRRRQERRRVGTDAPHVLRR